MGILDKKPRKPRVLRNTREARISHFQTVTINAIMCQEHDNYVVSLAHIRPTLINFPGVGSTAALKCTLPAPRLICELPVRKWLQPCDIVVGEFGTGNVALVVESVSWRILDMRKGDARLKTTGSWVAGGGWAVAFARLAGGSCDDDCSRPPLSPRIRPCILS